MLLTIFILIVVVLASFAVYASVSIQSCVYLKAFCRSKTDKKSIALTFDDGPHPINTPKVLEILKQYNVKATFFCIGSRAAENPDILKQIIADGHLVGNHTYDHSSSFPLLCKVEMEQELVKTERILNRIAGLKTLLFRPPFGVTNPNVATVVKKLGYKTIGWSIRSFDTVSKLSREQVLARIEGRLHGGGVILMHDDREKCDWLTEAVILKIREKGYNIKRLDELIEQ